MSRILEVNFPFLGYKNAHEYGEGDGESDKKNGLKARLHPLISLTSRELLDYETGYRRAYKRTKRIRYTFDNLFAATEDS